MNWEMELAARTYYPRLVNNTSKYIITANTIIYLRLNAEIGATDHDEWTTLSTIKGLEIDQLPIVGITGKQRTDEVIRRIVVDEEPKIYDGKAPNPPAAQCFKDRDAAGNPNNDYLLDINID
jgi:hypothetical protein